MCLDNVVPSFLFLVFSRRNHEGKTVCSILSLACLRHTTSRELVQLIIAFQTHKLHWRVILFDAECFPALGSSREPTSRHGCKRWHKKKTYLLLFHHTVTNTWHHHWSLNPITQTLTPPPHLPSRPSTHIAEPQERIGRLPHAASASARKISRDTRITIPGEELGNARALVRVTLYPQPALINAERGRGFVEFAGGNYAFTHKTTAHTRDAAMSVFPAPIHLKVVGNVAPSLLEHMPTSIQETEHTGTRKNEFQ